MLIEFLAFPLENSIWLLTSIIEVMESLVISVKFNLLIILMPNLNLKAKNYMNFTKLNPNIILKTGFFGVFMGIVSVWGWSKSYETLFWIGIGLTTTIYLKYQVKNHIFLHCVIIGLSWGFDCTLIQVIFFDIYTLNHPSFVSEILNFSPNYPKIFLILTGTLFGLIGGMIIFSIIKLSRIIKS